MEMKGSWGRTEVEAGSGEQLPGSCGKAVLEVSGNRPVLGRHRDLESHFLKYTRVSLWEVKAAPPCPCLCLVLSQGAAPGFIPTPAGLGSCFPLLPLSFLLQDQGFAFPQQRCCAEVCPFLITV